MREYMSPESFPRGSVNMWCSPSCPNYVSIWQGHFLKWSTWVARCHSAWDVEGIFPPLDDNIAMYNTWNAFYIERMSKICSSNIRGVVMVGPGGFAKFTFTAARSVIVTQSYNDKNESTIRLVTYLKNGFPRKMSTWRERGLNVVPDHSLLSGFQTSPYKSNTCK